MEVTLTEMLDARERRAGRQQTLLTRYGCTMICFTMNIAGPLKDSPLIRRGYAMGKRLLQQQLSVAGIPLIHFEEVLEKTGCEGIFLVQCSPADAKSVTTRLEDLEELGRLFDMDVLDARGQKIDRQELGLPGRSCLICLRDAKLCARSRTHSVAQLQEKTTQILTQAIDRDDAQTAARLACQALLWEVATTPKPGLVDRQDSGSHRDMDFFTFQASTAALWPYFAQCVRIGRQGGTPEETLRGLRNAGLLAEGAMMQATGGVNTHKGAIFSLGIICGALGRLNREDWQDPAAVTAQCAAITAGLTRQDFAGLTEETAKTTGQKLYLRYGITGARGQAEAGFPAVTQIGLPKLEEGLKRGLSINDAGCAALIAILAQTMDTNLIHRGGYETAQAVCHHLGQLLEKTPFPSPDVLSEWNDAFVRRNLSPGGSADLLALVYLLYLLKEESHV